jgi:hypothetical protein
MKKVLGKSQMPRQARHDMEGEWEIGRSFFLVGREKQLRAVLGRV